MEHIIVPNKNKFCEQIILPLHGEIVLHILIHLLITVLVAQNVSLFFLVFFFFF